MKETTTLSYPPLLSSPVWNMFRTVVFAKALQVVVFYNIPDLLKDGPKNVAELAAVTGTHEDTLYRLLRALASIGVVEEREGKNFVETAISRSLCADEPGTTRDLMLWLLGYGWSTIGALEQSIRTGRVAFDSVHEMSIWQWNSIHPDAHTLFNKAMTSFSSLEDPIIQAYDFSSIHTLADIGGGHGSFLRKILKAHPTLKGVLYDIPSVVGEAEAYFVDEQLEGRCQLVGGDFFRSAPQGADAYLIKHAIHNWDDQACIRILSNCRAATRAGAKLLIIEQIPASDKALEDAACGDLFMLLFADGGRERSVAECKALLDASGFSLNRVIPVNALYSVVEGVAI